MSVGDAFWFLIIQIYEKIAPRRFGHIVGITLIVKIFRGTNYICCPVLLAHHEMGIANEKEILQGIGGCKSVMQTADEVYITSARSDRRIN